MASPGRPSLRQGEPLLGSTAPSFREIAGRSRQVRYGWGGSWAPPRQGPWRLLKKLPGPIRRRLEIYEAGRVYFHEPSKPIEAGPRRALLISHDLSSSGAPKIVFEIARLLREWNHDVLVVSPVDGPYRAELSAIGVSVLIQGCLLANPALLTDFCHSADFTICNTTVTAHLVAALASITPCYIYLHEVSLLRKLLSADQGLVAGLRGARAVWAGSEASAGLVRAIRSDVKVLPYGLDAIDLAPASISPSAPLAIAVFGSYEPRKGQDLAVEAINRLSEDERSQFRLCLFGRVLDRDFFAKLETRAARCSTIEVGGELDAQAYRQAMSACDIVLVPSRDDTLPLVSIDALSGGRVLVCTRTTGTSAYLHDGETGFLADTPTADDIAAALLSALASRARLPEIAEAGRAVFQASFAREAFARRLADELGASTDASSQRLWNAA